MDNLNPEHSGIDRGAPEGDRTTVALMKLREQIPYVIIEKLLANETYRNA